MDIKVIMKVKLIPITIGSPEPSFQIGVDWIRVAIPAISMAFWERASVRSSGSFCPVVDAIVKIGTRFVANIARIC